jgi:hypothetical protein
VAVEQPTRTNGIVQTPYGVIGALLIGAGVSSPGGPNKPVSRTAQYHFPISLLFMQVTLAEMALGRHGRNPALLLAKMQFDSKLPGGHVGLHCCGRPKDNRRAGLVGRAVMIAVWDPTFPITPSTVDQSEA